MRAAERKLYANQETTVAQRRVRFGEAGMLCHIILGQIIMATLEATKVDNLHRPLAAATSGRVRVGNRYAAAAFERTLPRLALCLPPRESPIDAESSRLC